MLLVLTQIDSKSEWQSHGVVKVTEDALHRSRLWAGREPEHTICRQQGPLSLRVSEAQGSEQAPG